MSSPGFYTGIMLPKESCHSNFRLKGQIICRFQAPEDPLEIDAFIQSKGFNIPNVNWKLIDNTIPVFYVSAHRELSTKELNVLELAIRKLGIATYDGGFDQIDGGR